PCQDPSQTPGARAGHREGLGHPSGGASGEGRLVGGAAAHTEAEALSHRGETARSGRGAIPEAPRPGWSWRTSWAVSGAPYEVLSLTMTGCITPRLKRTREGKGPGCGRCHLIRCSGDQRRTETTSTTLR
ncbi:proline-rich acidic protein 1 isoform 1 precursor, partial [Daubentonia madagascariensis]